MSTPFLGEIRVFSFNFAPKGWAMCNGQLLPISQNQALFALLGTTYGGNGESTFALPDLRSRSAVHVRGSEDYVAGEDVGTEAVTLTTGELPAHSHPAYASSAGASTATPTGSLWAAGSAVSWSAASPDTAMDPGAIAPAGGGQPHDNRSPYLVLTYCICLQGIFPTQN